jgi:DNA repair exonuclease SbcCD ATPase subunit
VLVCCHSTPLPLFSSHTDGSFQAQRFADYENDIRTLTAELRLAKKRNDSLDSTATTESAKATGHPPPPVGLARLGSFMHSRKTSALAPSSTPTPRERELESLLAQSQAQRLAAENKVDNMSAEIEELTGSLFSQANEMVADERREGARLRERIRFLEERDAKFAMKVQRIEERDRERKRRLERLERAMGRIERARELLGNG